MALTGHVFLNPPRQSTHWVQVVCRVSHARSISLLMRGSSFSVMRGTNTYCGSMEISFLMHRQIPHSLAKNEYPSNIQMLQSRTRNNLRWLLCREVTMITSDQCYNLSNKLSMTTIKGHHHFNVTKMWIILKSMFQNRLPRHLHLPRGQRYPA
jgi:hypothetical protein